MNTRLLNRLIQVFRYLGYLSGLVGVLLVTSGRSIAGEERGALLLTIGGALVGIMLLSFLVTYVLRTLLFMVKGRSGPARKPDPS
ncbi:MAG TPA: hypothetical protein PKE55_08435 [Kiritimatiellia bacterium]|nr:hypothetical protein [Kiritimatiellia bacterium]